MMAKDSVKKRLETGLSFTEFSYQLVQGYDFLFLYENKSCKLQMGGSDQWGNIVTGTELIRRKTGGEAFALTCPLITKADGGKFGKTEKGNVWLDATLTSPYTFYQFWLNVSDADAEKYIKIFTSLDVSEIEQLIAEHTANPHLRILQKRLARELMLLVHSEQDYVVAEDASQILFGKGTTETLMQIDEATFLSVFEGVPQSLVNREKIDQGISLPELLTTETNIFPSKSELRRNLTAGAVSLNKAKIEDPEMIVNAAHTIKNKYILIQKGKKNYHLIVTQ